VRTFAARLAPLVAACIWLTNTSASARDVYPSKEGDYAIEFPAKPAEEIDTSGGLRVVMHVLKNDEVIYIAGHGDLAVAPKPEVELDASIEKYVAAIRGCRLMSRAPLAFARGGKPVAAKQFTYESNQIVGRGIVVVDGVSSYIVAASALKPYNRQKAVDAFLGSFALAPARKD